MPEPRSWTLEELTSDAETAKDLFRRSRLDEPLALYSQFFDIFASVFAELIDRLPALTTGSFEPSDLAELVGTEDAKTAFRYLAAPPVSEDDLRTLAETTLAPRTLRDDADRARRVRDIVLHVIDPHRFPWVREARQPTEHERTRAIVASAVLVAARKVETARRVDATRAQEEAVKIMLRGLQFEEVEPRDIPLLDDAPHPDISVARASSATLAPTSSSDCMIDSSWPLNARRRTAPSTPSSGSTMKPLARLGAWISASDNARSFRAR